MVGLDGREKKSTKNGKTYSCGLIEGVNTPAHWCVLIQTETLRNLLHGCFFCLSSKGLIIKFYNRSQKVGN